MKLTRFLAISALAVTPCDAYAGGFKDDPIYSNTWTGFYVGVNGGYGWGDFDGRVYYQNGTTPTYDIAGKQKTDLAGGFGGGQIGYNKQLSSIVLGVEADISGGDISGKGTFTTKNYGGAGAPIQTYAKTFDISIDYFGTVRGRIGYTFGNYLPYFTGGFAWGHYQLDNTVVGSLGDVHDKGTADATLTGWTIGGGLEAKIGGNWSLKAEYLYIDLGNENFNPKGTHNVNGQVFAFNTDHYSGDLTFSTVKVGLNYKLGSEYEPLK
jgi:outer membrane immunogenic protein